MMMLSSEEQSRYCACEAAVEAVAALERSLMVQVGLAEMKMAIEATGGMVVQTDTFHNPVFRDSLARIFARPGEAGHMGIASNATFEVHPPCKAVWWRDHMLAAWSSTEHRSLR